MSSIRRNLGLNPNLPWVRDKRVEGVSELMLAVRNGFAEPLTEEVLYLWHSMLMKGRIGIEIGSWRNHVEPMRIVSSAMGREKVHYETPPSS